MSSLRADLLAGLGSAGVSIAAGLVAAPFYIALAGREGFGVYGFFLTLQGVLMALDAGVSLSVTRRVAAEGATAASALVLGLERAAWCMALLVLAGLLPAAGPLARDWLHPAQLDAGAVAQALRVAAALIALRWPLYFYQAVLNGAHRIVAASWVQGVATVFSTAGSILALWQWDGSMAALFAWQLVVAAAQVATMRWLVRGALARVRPEGPAALARFAREAWPVGAMSAVGLLTLQLDRLVLSPQVALGQFADYVLAATAAGALYGFVAPFVNALYPRLAAVWAQGRCNALARTYLGSALALAAFLFPLAGVLVFSGRPLLLVWTGDARAAAGAAALLPWLALATTVHGVAHAPYALRLACGETRLALRLSLALLGVAAVLSFTGARLAGAPGVAVAMLVANAAYAVAASWVTHRRLLPAAHPTWLLRCTLLPGAGALGVAALCAAWARASLAAPLAQVAAAALAVALTWAGFLALPALRRSLREARPGPASLDP